MIITSGILVSVSFDATKSCDAYESSSFSFKQIIHNAFGLFLVSQNLLGWRSTEWTYHLWDKWTSYGYAIEASSQDWNGLAWKMMFWRSRFVPSQSRVLAQLPFFKQLRLGSPAIFSIIGKSSTHHKTLRMTLTFDLLVLRENWRDFQNNKTFSSFFRELQLSKSRASHYHSSFQWLWSK